ncbi:MAG TPA: tRNA (adenosine(37)-N6)-threonylcarbamoyltransferase complex transferase subunit TsaD [Defluviitoga sp.]|nr:tRNA (adenosine(37)-N6)-threonylcarbamoyltransferase complex transferase subunit TsaD [Defluviitoga sp.]HOP24124.1 tRNA (adenosine(37)-N6)-threonylcarbamoyltransferase complex transferase subunit TsaD [Defluviitoga sp.]HQD62420.1 tRNA (adenosine(37)-N6)-threonylcarbamoyltransferase complex transferase subunit TsaD [Defluviitoga sp.]
METSCDETAIAILEGTNNLLSNLIISQIDIHKVFGGVVPEIAARKHIEFLYKLAQKAFEESKTTPYDIDAIAATYGPGLIGSLLVGTSFAKGMSLSLKVPFIGVNHLVGHIYANFLDFPELKPPFLTLLVSGGHTMLILTKDYLEYEIIGQTRDDAAGEAFDKVARILGLGYPGGPIIEDKAKNGKSIYNFPKPLYDVGYDFSFSGLKTSVLYFVKEHPEAKIEDIAASFQEAITETLVHKVTKYALENNIHEVVIAGGVASNLVLRKKLDEYKDKLNIYYPRLTLCTDNAAMIARAAYEKYQRKLFSKLDLDVCPNLGFSEI